MDIPTKDGHGKSPECPQEYNCQKAEESQPHPLQDGRVHRSKLNQKREILIGPFAPSLKAVQIRALTTLVAHGPLESGRCPALDTIYQLSLLNLQASADEELTYDQMAHTWVQVLFGTVRVACSRHDAWTENRCSSSEMQQSETQGWLLLAINLTGLGRKRARKGFVPWYPGSKAEHEGGSKRT